MTRRFAVTGAAVLCAAVLSGCATPAPQTSDPATPPAASPTPTPTPEAAAAVEIAASGITVLGDRGSVLMELDYDVADPAEFERLAEVLSVEVVATEKASTTYCLVDWVEYDFEAFVFRVPGTFGTSGAFEAHVTAASVSSGAAVQGAFGVNVGASEEQFRAAAGPVFDIWAMDDREAIGFDEIEDGLGSQATLQSGVVTDIRTPRYFDADC